MSNRIQDLEKAARDLNAYAFEIPPDKMFRVFLTNEKGEQKYETYSLRNIGLAYHAGADFCNMSNRTEPAAKWRLTCVEEMGTR